MAFHLCSSSWKTEPRLMEEYHHICLIPSSSLGLCPCLMPLCSQQLIICLWAPHSQLLGEFGTAKVGNWLGRKGAKAATQFLPRIWACVSLCETYAGHCRRWRSLPGFWTLLNFDAQSEVKPKTPGTICQNLSSQVKICDMSAQRTKILWAGKVKEVQFGFVCFIFLFIFFASRVILYSDKGSLHF